MITGKVLKRKGWQQGRSMGLALAAAAALSDADAGLDSEAILLRLEAVRRDPDAHVSDPILGPLAIAMSRSAREAAERAETRRLRSEPLPYRIWGEAGIDSAAHDQMKVAMRLPI